jgi:hypothetical protein
MGKHDKKENKKNLPIARVTTHIKGMTKKLFFEDVERQGTTEGKLANEIITKFYI